MLSDYANMVFEITYSYAMTSACGSSPSLRSFVAPPRYRCAWSILRVEALVREKELHAIHLAFHRPCSYSSALLRSYTHQRICAPILLCTLAPLYSSAPLRSYILLSAFALLYSSAPLRFRKFHVLQKGFLRSLYVIMLDFQKCQFARISWSSPV